MPKDIPEEPSKDISKKTVAILVVLAIILSITSTLIAVARPAEVKAPDVPSGSAQIKVNVVEPPPEPVEAQIKVNVIDGE